MPDVKDSTLANLPAASAGAAADLFYADQGGVDKKLTLAQIGDVILVRDDVKFQNATDSLTGFQILDADGGVPVFNVDTINERVGIGTASPNAALHLFSVRPKIRLQDIGGAGSAAATFLEFYDVNVRQGWFGFGSSSNSTMTMANGVSGGHVRLSPGANADVLVIGSDIYTEGDGWQEFTSTIVGFTSTTIQEIWYKKVGKTVFVNFHISGASDATNLTFTLPFINENNADVEVRVAVRVADSGSFQAAPGMTFLGANSSIVSIFQDFAGLAFTATGTKAVQGEMWYQTP